MIELPTPAYAWLAEGHAVFRAMFREAVLTADSRYPRSGPHGNTLRAIEQRSDKIGDDGWMRFFIPADVALYTAYLLQHGEADPFFFDPQVGRGGLLVAAGAVLATTRGLRGAELLSHLGGVEVDAELREQAVATIVRGLRPWLGRLAGDDAAEIIRLHVRQANFFDEPLPQGALVIANPRSREVKERRRSAWAPYARRLAGDRSIAGLGLVVPLAISTAKAHRKLRADLMRNYPVIRAFHHDTRPRMLFMGIDQRITILIARRTGAGNQLLTTGFLTHEREDRHWIWESDFVGIPYSLCANVFPKVDASDIAFFLEQARPDWPALGGELLRSGGREIWVRSTGRYHMVASEAPPARLTSKWRRLRLTERGADALMFAIRHQEVLRWWRMFGDGRDLSMSAVLRGYRLPFPTDAEIAAAV